MASGSSQLKAAGRGPPDAPRPAHLDEARLAFDPMFDGADRPYLFAEEVAPRGKPLGVLPRAFTHLAPIGAAGNLDRALAGRR